MGFYVRKSLRAGPFRFNLSKSGLGVSAGVPGFRVGTGPRGNYVHVGGHGVYYRASPGRGSAAPSAPPTLPTWRPRPTSQILMQDTTGAAATELVPTGPGDLVAQLNEASGRRRLWIAALAAALTLALALPAPVGGIELLLAVPALIWLWLRDRARRSVVAFYEVDGAVADWFQALVEVFEDLGRVGGLWRVAASGRVKTTYQFKVNSGASNLISRAAASATLRGPGTLVTNIAVPSLVAGGHALHFLPDRLLVRSGRHFSDVSYGSLQIACAAQRFIEDGRVPRDATQVDTTWRYVNVNGTPDRRFNNNAQLPVMLYGRWELASANGLEWILDCSRLDVTERVESLMRAAPMPTAERGPDLVAT